LSLDLLLPEECVSKSGFIPTFQMLLEVLKVLLELIHMSAMIYFSLGPPCVSQLVEVWVGEPELFKVEGFGPGGDTQVETEGDRPVV